MKLPEPILKRVIVWREPKDTTLHIREEWTNGDEPEYIYDEVMFLERPCVPQNIRAYYQRLGFSMQ